MAAVLIISRDKDFSQVVAEQVKKELGAACQVAANAEEAKGLSEHFAVVVTSEAEAGKQACPVISVAGKTPLKLQDLLDDIAAMLQKPASDDSLSLGKGYALELRGKLLSHAGKSVNLTDKEMQLLQELASGGSKGVSREQLLKNVWGFEAVLDTHTLETHIYRLRGKFRELANDDSMIAANDGGYALVIK